MAIPKSRNNPNRKIPRIPKTGTVQKAQEPEQENTKDVEQYKQRIAALEAQLAKKQEQEATEPEKKSTPTVETPAPKQKSPKRKVKAANQPEPEQVTEDDDEWAVHPRTGVKYRKIPTAKLDADGMPVATITDDIDLMDFNNSAEQFLGHLQVAPSKDEQKRMRAERERKAAEASAKFNEKWKDYKPSKPKSS